MKPLHIVFFGYSPLILNTAFIVSVTLFLVSVIIAVRCSKHTHVLNTFCYILNGLSFIAIVCNIWNIGDFNYANASHVDAQRMTRIQREYHKLPSNQPQTSSVTYDAHHYKVLTKHHAVKQYRKLSHQYHFAKHQHKPYKLHWYNWL